MKKLLIGLFAILSMGSFVMAEDDDMARLMAEMMKQNEKEAEKILEGGDQDHSIPSVEDILAENEAMRKEKEKENQDHPKTDGYTINKETKDTKTILIGENNTVTFDETEIKENLASKKDMTEEEIKDTIKLLPNQIIGQRSRIKNGFENILLGNNSKIIKEKEDIKTVSNVAIGDQITMKGANDSVAIGAGSEVFDAKGGIALGGFSQVKKTITEKDNNKQVLEKDGIYKVVLGKNPIEPNDKGSLYTAMALGYASSSHSMGAVAVGGFSTATGKESLALGRNSIAYGEQSVALGSKSIANRKAGAIGKFGISILNGETQEDIYKYANVNKEEHDRLATEIKDLKQEIDQLEKNKIKAEKQQEFEEINNEIKKLEKSKKSVIERKNQIDLTDDDMREINKKAIEDLDSQLSKIEEEIKMNQSKLDDLVKHNLDEEKVAQIKVKNESLTKKLDEKINIDVKLNAWKSTLGAVSLGVRGEHTRQLTNLAAGTEDDDAVNLAQLKSVMSLPVKFFKGNEEKASMKLAQMEFEFGEGLKVDQKDGRVLISLDSKGLDNNASITKIKNDVSNSGAMSAALSGLGTVTSQKGQGDYLLASLGTYKGKQAIAIGATKHIGEKGVLSLGVSKGLSKGSGLMGNISFGWKFDDKKQSDNNEVKKLKNELNELRKELEEIKKC